MTKIIRFFLIAVIYTITIANISGQCGIFDLTASFDECDGTSYQAHINFQVDQNIPIDTFSVTINGDYIGDYVTQQLPITIHNVGIADNYHVLVCGTYLSGQDLFECCEDVNVTPPACNTDCAISNLHYSDLSCDGTHFEATINFDVQNPGNDYFDLFIDGEFFDYYLIDDLPINISSAYDNSQNHLPIKVCINDVPDCCETVVLDLSNCVQECVIDNVIVEQHDCENGQFYVDIEVHASGYGNDGFNVRGNGHDYGNFSYEEPFITLGPFDGDGTTSYEFVIIDNHFPDCQYEYDFGTVDCDHTCTLGAIYAAPYCEDENAYANIYFYSEGMTGNFSVHGNGHNYGTYEYDGDTTSILVGPLPAIADTVYEFIVIDETNDGCISDYTLLDVFDCGGGECEIGALIVEAYDCQDGLFKVDLAFESAHTSDTYFVFVNGEIFGPFNYNEPYVTIGPFAGDGETPYSFYVIDGEDAGCYSYYELGTIDCPEPEELVWPGDANNNNRADHYDILNIGVGFGETGEDRPSQGNDWNGVEAPDWNQTFPTGLNYKYADCDGNGHIDEGDLAVIVDNYGETHGTPLAITPLPSTNTDPMVFLAFPTNIPEGVPFEIPVILGTANTPMNDLYGTAFTIQINPILLESFHITEVQFHSSWMGTPGEDLIYISKIHEGTGKIDIGISRTNHLNASGYGQVATLVGIVDDIAGISEVNNDIELRSPIAVDVEQNLLPIFTPMNHLVTDALDKEKPSTVDLINALVLFPNPTEGDVIHLGSKYDVGFENITATDINGQNVAIKIMNEGRQISLMHAPPGIYIISIQIGEQIVKRKIVRQ